MPASLAVYEFLMNRLMRTAVGDFTVHFFGSLLSFRAVSGTTFCVVKKTLPFNVPFFLGYIHLSTRPRDSRRQV